MPELQNPPVAAPESALVPGMSAPSVEGLAAPLYPTTGGFPNITDSSGPGLEPTQVPGAWVYDFDPGSGSARATFLGIVQFTSGGSATAGVTSFNTRSGTVTLTAADVTGVGAIVNPSPALTGTPTAPTATAGTSTTQIATTAFVGAAIAASAGVVTFNGRNGAVTLSGSDVVSAGGAPSASPALTGTPTAPTPGVADNSSAIATTAFVNNWGAQNAVLSFNGRRGAVVLSLSDITSAGGAPLASPAFTGTPSGPTAAPATSTTQLATTAFVTNAVTAAASGVASFNTRTGAVTLQLADVTGVGGAPLASPALTGTPTAPTATAGTNTTQVATTAFVTAAIGAGAGVASFNGRTGVVTLQLADVTAVGGAPLASPTFTGVPAGPTATAGTSTTQLATTAFVTTADNLKAPLASPVFTGDPQAPTPATADNDTSIATTAFVKAQGYATGGPFLPLAGGTLTGALTGTGATFSGNVVANQFTSNISGSGTVALNINQSVSGTGGNLQCQMTTPTHTWVFGVVGQGNPQGNDYFVYDGTNSATRFAIDAANGATINTSGSWTTFSDPRTKSDIAPYASGLAAVLALEPITYRYNGEFGTPTDDESITRYGLDALATQAVMPELVYQKDSGAGDHPVLMLDNGPLIYALVNAIKALEARLAALEGGRT